MADQFDLLIVGGGPGGYVAAIRGAQLGLNVAVVEKERPGGVCLNWGCISTKAMLRSAEVLETMRHAADYGVLADNVRLDYSAVLKRKDRIVKDLTDGVGSLLKSNKVTVIKGHARFTGRTTVDVYDVSESPLGAGGPLYNATPGAIKTGTFSGKDVIIATGSTPVVPPISGAKLPGAVTSDGAFLLPEVPRRIVIVGGAAVGAEWASMFHTFGAEVTLVELLPTLLPAEDVDMGTGLARSFTTRGIRVLTGHMVTALEEHKGGLRVSVTDPESASPRTVDAEVVLFGVGREPNTAYLGLEQTGVTTDARGFVLVDEGLHTSAPHVYAIGDITGHLLLAHVASHQGLVAVANVAGRPERMDYTSVPAATFTHPEVASVGLTEAKAVEQGHDVAVGKFPFSALGRAQSYGATEGLVKVVAESRYHQVLGMHIIGPSASDLIAEAVLAINMEATLESIADTIHAHPTLGEGSMEASMAALGLPIHMAPPRRTR